MSACTVCGGSDFELLDGHYYCDECNTKIENVGQRQEEEDEYCDHVFSRLSITSSGKKVDKAEKKKKEFGEKWGTHECFNIIICKQVEKLIQLGASPHLKNVVFYLWAKYLKKCEVAFMGSEAGKDWLPRLGTAPRLRDIIILYEGKTKLPNKYHNRKRNKDESDEVDDPDDPNESNIENQVEPPHKKVLHSESSPENTLENEEETLPVQIKVPNVKRQLRFNAEAQKKKDECTKRVVNRSQKLSAYNDYMSIEKTAAFCYLGLLLTEDSILLFDLIRWAREDHFPYVSVSYLLPSTMKLQSNDWRFISAYKVPELEKINELARKLAVYLEVNNLPEKPLMPIIARFVTDINLPNELLSVIHKLIEGKLSPVEWKAAGIPKYELIAMAVIIIALKLLFGLNDDIERKLSIIAKDLTEHFPEETELFIWEDWMKNTMHKYNFISHTHAPSAIFSESDLYNVNSFKTFYEEAIYNHWHPKETTMTKNFFSSEFRVTLKKIFSDLNEVEEHTPMCPATSFPLRSWTKYYKSTIFPDNTLYSKNFAHCSLAHVTNWKKYQQDPKIWEIYNCHLGSNTVFHNSDKPFEDCILAHNQYWIHHPIKSDPFDVPYVSFNWLLSICSKYVEVSEEELYSELMKIENAIFCSSGQPKRLPQEKIQQASFIRKRR